jgi:hypothetical protein
MYSIFHTPYSGSNLLAYLLSKSITTFTEPDWSLNLKNEKNPIDHIDKNHLDGHLINYPSMYCYLMPQTNGKKIFLYKPIVPYLIKAKESRKVTFDLDLMKPYLHPKTKIWQFNKDSNLHCNTLIWMDKCFWAIESQNVLLINADTLFEEPQKIAKKICRFFEIDYMPVEVNYNVALTGLNNNDSIDLDKVSNKLSYSEPIYPVDFDLIKWKEQLIETHPFLTEFE